MRYLDKKVKVSIIKRRYLQFDFGVIMGVLSTIILVLCVIICIIIVLLVLVQNEDEMGTLLGGNSSSTFGARSATALAKITRVAVGIFFVLVLSLALLNRSKNTSFENEVKNQQQNQSTEWWNKDTESGTTNTNESTDTTDTSKTTNNEESSDTGSDTNTETTTVNPTDDNNGGN